MFSSATLCSLARILVLRLFVINSYSIVTRGEKLIVLRCFQLLNWICSCMVHIYWTAQVGYKCEREILFRKRMGWVSCKKFNLAASLCLCHICEISFFCIKIQEILQIETPIYVQNELRILDSVRFYHHRVAVQLYCEFLAHGSMKLGFMTWLPGDDRSVIRQSAC